MKKTQKYMLLAAAAFIGSLAGVSGSQHPTEEKDIPTIGISFVSSSNDDTSAACKSDGCVGQLLRLVDVLEKDQQVTGELMLFGRSVLLFRHPEKSNTYLSL